MIEWILTNDIGLKNWISDISFGLEGLHETRIVEIQNILAHLFDTLDVFVVGKRNRVHLLRDDLDLGFNFDFGFMNRGTILEIERLMVMQNGKVFDKLITLLNEQDEVTNDCRHKSVLISLDFIIGTDVENLVGDNITVILDFLDELGVRSKVLDTIGVGLSSQFDRD